MTTTAPQRYHGLDAFRAAMMLLGLVIHSAINYVEQPIEVWPYQDPATSGWFDLLVLTIHVFRMPAFFVMAGFFSALLASRSLWTLARNRLERVAAPFVMAWLLLSPLVILASGLVLSLRYPSVSDRLASLGTPVEAQSVWLWQDNTFHLWFLYTLLYLNAGGLVLALLARRVPSGLRRRGLDLFAAITRSPGLRLLVLSVLAFAATLLMPRGAIETPVSFVPHGPTLLAYAPFFLFGWLLHERRELVGSLTRLAGTQVVLALPITLLHAVALARAFDPEHPELERWRLIALASLALASWLFVFGLTGLCLRWLGGHSPVVRYVSDSSYWLYLIHLPFTIVLPALFMKLDWPAWLKFTGVLGLTTVIGFVSYHLFVRSTLIGRLLNGRRYPMRLPFGRATRRRPEGE